MNDYLPLFGAFLVIIFRIAIILFIIWFFFKMKNKYNNKE